MGPGSRFSARPHSPDEAAARRTRDRQRQLRSTYRHLPRVHGVRHGVSFGRSVRFAARSRAAAGRARGQARLRRPRLPPHDLLDVSASRAAPRAVVAAWHLPEARAFSASCTHRGCSACCRSACRRWSVCCRQSHSARQRFPARIPAQGQQRQARRASARLRSARVLRQRQ